MNWPINVELNAVKMFPFKSLPTCEFSDPQNAENVQPYSSNSIGNYNPMIVNPVVKIWPHRAAHTHYLISLTNQLNQTKKQF